MSYLEILAENDNAAREEYSENAKDLLVEQNEYEDNVEARDHHPDELENQDDFKKFGGSHQQAAGPPNLSGYAHVLKNSIHHDKHVKTHVINIDSRFRSTSSKSSTDFLFVLNSPMKNVMSVRVSSVELPNTYYTFSKTRGNVSFTIFTSNTSVVITLPDGNYSHSEMRLALNLVLASNPLTSSITVKVIGTSGLMYFYSTASLFDIDFENGIFSARSSDWGLGYALGFRIRNVNKQRQYTSGSNNNIKGLIEPNAKTCYIGTSILDTLDSNYLMLTLNSDWKVVCNYAPDRTQHFSFMKIIMTSGKNSVLFDNGANTITKEYTFSQPANLTAFPVRLSDPYDQTIDLNGMEFSFTMEIKEILDSSLYESIRTS